MDNRAYLIKKTKAFFQLGGSQFPDVSELGDKSNSEIRIFFLSISMFGISFSAKLATIGLAVLSSIALLENLFVFVLATLILTYSIFILLKTNPPRLLSKFTLVASIYYSFVLIYLQYVAMDVELVEGVKSLSTFIGVTFFGIIPYILYPLLMGIIFTVMNGFESISLKAFRRFYTSLVFIMSAVYISGFVIFTLYVLQNTNILSSGDLTIISNLSVLFVGFLSSVMPVPRDWRSWEEQIFQQAISKK